MIKWLGLDINSYIRYLKENEDLAWSYYDDQFLKFFNDYQYVIDNVPEFMGWSEWSTHEPERKQYFLEYLIAHSCFLVFSIILFQNVRNGKEILKDTRANNISHTEIMKDQIRTK
jgi:hypothetical protein